MNIVRATLNNTKVGKRKDRDRQCTVLYNCQFISFTSSQTFFGDVMAGFLLLVDVLDWIFMARHLRCIYT